MAGAYSDGKDEALVYTVAPAAHIHSVHDAQCTTTQLQATQHQGTSKPPLTSVTLPCVVVSLVVYESVLVRLPGYYIPAV